MAWASTSKVILGCIAFAIWWLFAVFPAVPFLPIGRTAGSILGATLMVVFRVITPNHAFAAVDLPILGLLFGTMVISVYLARAGLFKYLEKALSWRTRGGKDFLCRLCLLAALSSALFTNDTTCVVLTSFVLELCREKKLHPKPFLIALACSSNIGSAATPIGNPQNLVIAVSSGISFGRFLVGVLPAVAVGLVVNTLLLLAVYGRSLSLTLDDSPPSQQSALPVLRNSEIPSTEEAGRVEVDLRWVPNGEGEFCRKRPSNQHSLELFPVINSAPELSNAGDECTERRNNGENSLELGVSGRSEPEIIISSNSSSRADRSRVPCGDLEARPDAGRVHKKSRLSKACACVRNFYKRYLWKASVYLVTIGMLAALLAGLSLPWTAITAAVVMMVLDFSDAGPSLAKVSLLPYPCNGHLRTFLPCICAECPQVPMPSMRGCATIIPCMCSPIAFMTLSYSDAYLRGSLTFELVLVQVSYALLVFFSGMFIATSGFNATGAPEQFWIAVEPHSRIDSASGVSVLSLVVTVLSNVASNVPTGTDYFWSLLFSSIYISP